MGRSGDGGCDGAYLFCNSELVHEDEIKSVADRSREAQLRVVIIQAKNELSFNENVIMKWKTLASNVLDFDKELFNFRDRYDSRLIDFFAMFRRLRQDLMGKTVSISFEFVYVSLGVVAAFENGEHFCDGICYTKFLHLCINLCRNRKNEALQIIVNRFCYAFILYHAAKVFV